MAVTGTAVGEKFDLVPPNLIVQSLRDSGYKNTAYAIAELIDNSIQAGATSVELLCAEEERMLQHRQRRRVKQIAVLDNGSGMDRVVLRTALQFGNGTHLEDRRGIGRFGMGLPSSSISQCPRVDVWSWQDGPESALQTYIDIDEIRRGEMTEVPEPKKSAIPKVWREMARSFGPSGTLVVWSEPDRLMWRTGRAIIQNSEFLIGRIYRRFINSGRVTIRHAVFLENTRELSLDEDAKVNDPLYLMSPSSTPAPFDTSPMFQAWGEPHEIKVRKDGKDYPVVVTLAYAREEARRPGATGAEAGALPHGKHAAKNVGVSVMRADRELDMVTTGFVNTYDPLDRWWGVEVDFPPELDEIFGVTNNKQAARNFADVAAAGTDGMLEDGETLIQMKLRLKEDDDPRGPLLEIRDYINSNLSSIKQLIGDQRLRSRSSSTKRYGPESPEMQATAKTRERQQSGHTGASDEEEKGPAEEREATLEAALEQQGIPRAEARELAASTVSTGMKYLFTQAGLESPAFFAVESRAGVLTITLNTKHPAYTRLLEVLEREDEEASAEALKERLQGAADGLKILLSAWARYEDELPPGQRRDRVQEARFDWGRVARDFLSVST